MIRTNILRAAGKRVHLPSSNPSLLSGTKTTRARQHFLDVAQPFPCFRHHIHCTQLNNATPRNEVNLPLEHTSNPTALPPAPTDLLELYRGLVAAGRLNWDDEQVRCIMKVRPHQCFSQQLYAKSIVSCGNCLILFMIIRHRSNSWLN